MKKIKEKEKIKEKREKSKRMSELLRELYCGLTNDHVVKEPISLSCGHSICKQCVPDQVKIKCKICSIEMDRSDIEIETESPPIKRMKLLYLSELFEELEKSATNEINSFKSLIHLFFVFDVYKN